VDPVSAASPSGALDPAFPASREELELWPQIHLNPAYSDAAIGPSGLQKCWATNVFGKARKKSV
jgi:hypothetical protein